jgi:hypothetical protein
MFPDTCWYGQIFLLYFFFFWYVELVPRACLHLSVTLWIYNTPSLSLFLSMALQPFGTWPIFQFLNLYTVGRISWTGNQPVTRPLSTHRATQTQNKRPQTSMYRVGFEPTIPVFERAKTVHALDRAATLIGCIYNIWHQIQVSWYSDKSVDLFAYSENAGAESRPVHRLFCLRFFHFFAAQSDKCQNNKRRHNRCLPRPF